MASDRWQRIRRWARRRRTALLVGGAALALVAIAAYLIYDIATEPVVGGDSTASDPFTVPSGTPTLPPPGTNGTTGLDPAAFGLPTGGLSVGCDVTSFTMSFTSDAPIAIAGYLSSGGESDYFPNDATGSVTLQQCPTDPSVLIIAQAGPTASRITCTTTRSGRVVETQTASGSYGIVACYA
ncbi:MAG: hypothetical protein P1U38_04725 [Aeromicrobium sp.]|uniref:hypothetical protein n=1 Tax=Aeromicrobium sp. TaxID=1871063 RepID=UPI002615BBE1|nr:hypothetical protein [Aeromicrobium sp.]MDF1704056.1 hypothetical protein [Aeromicrobium sp.]